MIGSIAPVAHCLDLQMMSLFANMAALMHLSGGNSIVSQLAGVPFSLALRWRRLLTAVLTTVCSCSDSCNRLLRLLLLLLLRSSPNLPTSQVQSPGRCSTPSASRSLLTRLTPPVAVEMTLDMSSSDWQLIVVIVVNCDSRAHQSLVRSLDSLLSPPHLLCCAVSSTVYRCILNAAYNMLALPLTRLPVRYTVFGW